MPGRISRTPAEVGAGAEERDDLALVEPPLNQPAVAKERIINRRGGHPLQRFSPGPEDQASAGHARGPAGWSWTVRGRRALDHAGRGVDVAYGSWGGEVAGSICGAVRNSGGLGAGR